MTTFDGTGHHPSESIPNAAYPDAPYQPGGTGPQRRESQSGSSPYQSQPSASHSNLPGASSSSQTLSHLPPTTQWSPTETHDLALPQEPPPPYDATTSSSSRGPNYTHTIPLRTLPSQEDFQQHQNQNQQQQQPLVNSYYSAGEGTKTTGPAMDAILHRRRRIKLFILIICAIVIGFIILAVGIGVAKGRPWGHNDDNGGSSGSGGGGGGSPNDDGPH